MPETLALLRFRLSKVRDLGAGALAQLDESDLHWTPDPEVNSVAVTVKHMHGNMLSRWTDFLNSDGEKPWRERDGEFTADPSLTREAVMALWDEGWSRVESALAPLTDADLDREVTVRGQSLTVLDAALRQHSHYSYHVGQIVLLAKMRLGERWQTLSVARGASKDYRPSGKD